VSFNLNLKSQSPRSLFNGTWQKRPRELDYRLRFEIEETAQGWNNRTPISHERVDSRFLVLPGSGLVVNSQLLRLLSSHILVSY